VIAGESVFVGCDDGNLYELALSNGKKLWQFRAGAALKASPAVGRGHLVIGSTDGAIYCFGG
jgi:outer membrane protein assembly factor BamB